MKSFTVLLAIVLLTSVRPLAAQIITDRPDFADATIPVPVGMLQVESGYLYGKTPGVDQHTLGQLLVKTGLTDNMEIRLGINSYENIHDPVGDVSGFSDGSLGIKFRLLKAKEKTGPGSFNLSTIISTGIPSGQREFRSYHLSPGMMLTADMALSPNWTWAPFAQYTYLEDGAGQYNELSAGFSLLRPLSAKTGWYVEYYITVAETGYREDNHYIGSGFTRLLSDQIQLDLYGGSALNGITPDYFIGAGVSFMFAMGN